MGAEASVTPVQKSGATTPSPLRARLVSRAPAGPSALARSVLTSNPCGPGIMARPAAKGVGRGVRGGARGGGGGGNGGGRGAGPRRWGEAGLARGAPLSRGGRPPPPSTGPQYFTPGPPSTPLTSALGARLLPGLSQSRSSPLAGPDSAAVSAVAVPGWTTAAAPGPSTLFRASRYRSLVVRVGETVLGDGGPMPQITPSSAAPSGWNSLLRADVPWFCFTWWSVLSQYTPVVLHGLRSPRVGGMSTALRAHPWR